MRIGIIGLGVVGGAYYKALQYVGYEVYGYDKFNGKGNVNSIPELLNKQPELLFLCLPTPMQYPEGFIDLSAFHEVLPQIAHANTAIVIKSTVIPTFAVNMMDKHNISIISNPEFLTEKNAELDVFRPCKVVIGYSLGTTHQRDIDRLTEVNRKLGATEFFYTDNTTAELAKYASNALFATKISFANEMYDLAKSIGARWEDIVSTLYADPRVGSDHLTVYPSRAYGGMCLPKDVNALHSAFKNQTPLLGEVIRKNRELGGR